MCLFQELLKIFVSYLFIFGETHLGCHSRVFPSCLGVSLVVHLWQDSCAPWLFVCLSSGSCIAVKRRMDLVSLWFYQTLVSAHTLTRAQEELHTVNPKAGLLCHTGGCCVIG